MSDYGMSYGSSTTGSPPQDVVPGEQYRYALTNFVCIFSYLPESLVERSVV
jgi:hypothetical protein